MRKLDETRSLARASDAELLAWSKSCPEAFGEFFDRHHKDVIAFFYRRTGCPEIAADLTSETFAAAFLGRKGYENTGKPATAWLFVIARRKLIDSLRHGRAERKARSRLAVRPISIDDQTIEELEEQVDLRSVRTEIRQAMTAVPLNQAQAVYMRVGLELPYSVIAQRLQCSEGTARVRVMRGLARLSQAMGVT